MPNIEDLKAQGFVERRELMELVADCTKFDVDYVSKALTGPMVKIRILLVRERLIVEPDDSTWRCLYHPDLQYFLVAYLMWHSFGERRSAPQVLRFYVAFEARDAKVLGLMPRRAKDRLLRHDKKRGKPDNVVQLHNAG